MRSICLVRENIAQEYTTNSNEHLDASGTRVDSFAIERSRGEGKDGGREWGKREHVGTRVIMDSVRTVVYCRITQLSEYPQHSRASRGGGHESQNLPRCKVRMRRESYSPPVRNEMLSCYNRSFCLSWERLSNDDDRGSCYIWGFTFVPKSSSFRSSQTCEQMWARTFPLSNKFGILSLASPIGMLTVACFFAYFHRSSFG